MLIGVKFCGGCNEQYDRKAAYEKIKDHFKDRVDFEFVRENGVYDALILMSGCPNRCASIDNYSYHNKLVSVWKEDKVDDAFDQIESYLNDK